MHLGCTREGVACLLVLNGPGKAAPEVGIGASVVVWLLK